MDRSRKSLQEKQVCSISLLPSVRILNAVMILCQSNCFRLTTVSQDSVSCAVELILLHQNGSLISVAGHRWKQSEIHQGKAFRARSFL